MKVFESISDALFILNPNYIILEANQAAISSKCYRLFHGADQVPEKCLCFKTIKEKRAFTAEMPMELSGKDITEKNKHEKRMQEALKERSILLKEVHHRVKNNLQVISSLLDMTIMRTNNQMAIDLFTDARAKLYRSDRFDQIDMVTHIRELVGYLSQIYAKRKRLITPVIEPSDVYLSVTQAIPCALVLNEVISNEPFQENEIKIERMLRE
ncbi:MAG: sensor histidine kinase [Methanosarcinales archaeon]